MQYYSDPNLIVSGAISHGNTPGIRPVPHFPLVEYTGSAYAGAYAGGARKRGKSTSRQTFSKFIKANMGNRTYQEAVRDPKLKEMYRLYKQRRGRSITKKKRMTTKKMTKKKLPAYGTELTKTQCVKYIKDNKKRLKRRASSYILPKYYCPETGRCFQTIASRRKKCPQRSRKITKRKPSGIRKSRLVTLGTVKRAPKRKISAATCIAHKKRKYPDITRAEAMNHYCKRTKACYLRPLSASARNWCNRK